MGTVQHVRPIYNFSIYGWLLWDYVHTIFKGEDPVYLDLIKMISLLLHQARKKN